MFSSPFFPRDPFRRFPSSPSPLSSLRNTHTYDTHRRAKNYGTNFPDDSDPDIYDPDNPLRNPFRRPNSPIPSSFRRRTIKCAESSAARLGLRGDEILILPTSLTHLHVQIRMARSSETLHVVAADTTRLRDAVKQLVSSDNIRRAEVSIKMRSGWQDVDLGAPLTVNDVVESGRAVRNDWGEILVRVEIGEFGVGQAERRDVHVRREGVRGWEEEVGRVERMWMMR